MKKNSWLTICLRVVIIAFAIGVAGIYLLSRSPSKELDLNRSAFEELALRASQGEANAAVRISDYYLVVKQDIKKSVGWRAVAAKLGDVKSQEWIESYQKQNEKYGKNDGNHSN